MLASFLYLQPVRIISPDLIVPFPLAILVRDWSAHIAILVRDWSAHIAI